LRQDGQPIPAPSSSIEYVEIRQHDSTLSI
jgi:hypothetical protein